MARRCQANETGTLGDLVPYFERPLFYFASKTAGSEDVVQDAMQGVWVQVSRKIVDYRDNVNRVRGENEPGVRRPRVLAAAAWIFCVGMATIWIWTSPTSAERGPFLAGVFMIVGAVEVIKHRIEASRVQLPRT